MKRKIAIILFLFLIVLSAAPATGNAKADEGLTPESLAAAEMQAGVADGVFITLAAASDRPSSGLDLYKNIHLYMWRPVYMMAKVDYYVKGEVGTGDEIFIRTWHGQGHKSILASSLSSSDFFIDPAPKFTWDGVPIVADAVLSLPSGLKFPSREFEFVGIVCGTYLFHTEDLLPVHSLPRICIPADNVLRIRSLPRTTVVLDE